MDCYLPNLNLGAVREYLIARRQEIEDFVSSLVLLETPSFNYASQSTILKTLAEKFETLPLYCRIIKGVNTGGLLYVRPKIRHRKRPLQLILGHCDTVWPIGTLSQMPLLNKDGKIHGPGIFDMKAGLAQIIFAMQTINSLNLPLDLDPVILINSDEETGSHQSTPLIKRLAKIAERAFVLEPPLGLDGKLKTARKGLGRFTTTIKGKAAHAGLDPEAGASAIVELSYQIQKLFAFNDPEKGITVNVGMIEGGSAVNVVAPESKAIIDVRVISQNHAHEITEKIYNLKPVTPGTEIKIKGFIGRPPMEKNAANQRLWKLAEAAGKRMGINLQQATAGGGSDGNTTSQYTATLDGLGTVGDGAHSSHEFIFFDKFFERTLLLISLMTAKSINPR